ncbi:MAG: dTDP-4-dehydrorhamnose reductase [Chitinophagaceae bacterium]
MFLSKEELPIQQTEAVNEYFKTNLPAFCINCAAYTAVDKAETEQTQAMLINSEAVGVLAAACKSVDAKFIHISTDYVFDGTGTKPYTEDDKNSPVNYYGLTKLEGEKAALRNNNESVVIRTSWVYSEYGNNFVKTMMRLMKERESLNVVNDQVGSPTYAADLATFIISIVEATTNDSKNWTPGIYHYSNEGIISWYDFAVAIRNGINSKCAVNPIPTAMYPTPAKRPAYSAMDKSKVKRVYNAIVPQWQESLAICLKQMS